MSRIAPLVLAVAMFMEMMDATVISTSLPAIAADIGTEPIALKLAMTAYLVALAIFIPLSAWIADRFGARNVFRVAIVVFMVGSLACAASDSLGTFVVSRFLQGIGGSVMVPLARLILVRGTPKHDLVNAMAWLAMPALVGPLMGPPLGGFLTTYLTWHWIFFINIPIGIGGIIAATLFLPDFPAQKPQPIDWTGFFLTATAFSGILFGLSVISLPVLPPIVGISAVFVGALSLVLYLRHAARVENPILDPRIFRHENFRLVSMSTFLFRVAMGTTPFLLPLMLQLGFGYTPFEAGQVMLFGALGAISAKLFVKPAFKRFGYRSIAFAATAISTGVFFMSSTFRAETPMVMMMATMLTAGLARSTYFTGSNAVQFGDVDEDEASQASAIFAVMVQLGLATGVALAGGLLELRTFVTGHELVPDDFRTTFRLVGLFSLLSFLPIFWLKHDAGSEVSGHQARRGENPAVGGS
ncbi:MAG: multidrug efflux MFS transporter [Hyphomicrobiaceae bacterium]|nr:multidrug efflux MFS transporter [Hyphomicrobiaceae bacterium]MCC0024653.1 multidrug efflux MFS transporter [Hyphomicrobiaceae bacterium]